jgi:hypothetical protein
MEQALAGISVRMKIADVTHAADPEERHPRETKQALLKVAGGQALLETHYPTRSLVWAHNDAYSFRLDGQGKAPREWKLDHAGASGGHDSYDVESDVRYDPAMHFLLAPWQVSVTPLTYLVESPYFESISLKRAAERDSVVMQFRFSPPDRPPPRTARELTPLDTPMREGTITFAPNLNWAITEYDFISRGGGRNRRQVTYDGLVDGMPRLRRVVDRMGGADVAGGREIRCEVEEWTRRVIPPEEFTLTAYGMPEFVGGRPFFSRIAILLLVLVSLILALAAGFWFVSKRRRSA